MKTLQFNNDPRSRAFAVYFRSGHPGLILDQPSSDSGVENCNGKDYVVLRNNYRVLRVYRIMNNGALKRLIRYPRAFDKGTE